MLHTPFALPVLLALIPAAASFDVYGVKSCGSSPPACGAVPSAVPAHLFGYALGAPAVTDLGLITRGGVGIDVDGLALSPVHGLLGFELTHDGSGGVQTSALVQLDATTAQATAIGPPLARELRGAAFGIAGELWVVDAASDELLRVDPVTGTEVAGSALPLTEAGAPFDVSTVCDLALRENGQAYLVSAFRAYALDTAAGAVTEVAYHGQRSFAGATFAAGAPADEMQAFDVSGTDDVGYLSLDAPAQPWTDIEQDVLPSFNAGRGDLAADVVLPVAGCAFRNGTGVNPAGFGCLSAPVLGGTWTATIALAPGTVLTAIAIAPGGPDPGSPFPFGPGELLVALLPPPILHTALGTHAIPVPATPTLAGVVLPTQGARVSLPGGALSVEPMNAQDLTLGY